MIDRTIRHGEFISCAMSGIMFGLWHGNFQQFFYAFFVGVLFAFVYIRTGNIIYTMILHASMNLVTSTITIELLVELIRRTGINIETGTIAQHQGQCLRDGRCPLGTSYVVTWRWDRQFLQAFQSRI